MKRPLIIALLIGLVAGCAELPLDHAAHQDLAQQADGRHADKTLSARAVNEETDEQAEADEPWAPVLITDSVLESDSFGNVTLTNDQLAACHLSAPSYWSELSLTNDAESDDQVHLLPPVNDGPAKHSDSSEAQEPVDLGSGGDHAPQDANAPPLFMNLQDHPLLFNLLNDQANFYRRGSLEWLAVGVGGAAILANTHADAGFGDAYGEFLRPSDTKLDFLKQFGNGVYVIPSLSAIWLFDYGIDSWLSNNESEFACTAWLQEWSGRSLRGLIVGGAPVVVLQYAIGSARPSEGIGSGWHPLRHHNGVSGHAFVGAVPFWTAAQMTDCCALDVSFYAAGTLAGWARIHTDTHYLSQVLLGWWLASMSVSAVNHTEWQKHQWYTVPTVDDDGVGIALLHLW
ncbi:MAG TPA: phosphatase PAP2 family protein [Pirellulales bacterium]|jgi:hypothetical protein|nr:phosphatase PAP2 family protein [Pirellulales bacterium]